MADVIKTLFGNKPVINGQITVGILPIGVNINGSGTTLITHDRLEVVNTNSNAYASGIENILTTRFDDPTYYTA